MKNYPQIYNTQNDILNVLLLTAGYPKNLKSGWYSDI